MDRFGYRGGALVLQESRGETLPVFLFEVEDLARVRPIFETHHVQLDVRFDRAGHLAYTLEVPDLGSTPWAIRVPPDKVAEIEAAQRTIATCVTMVRDTRGGSMGMDAEMYDLTHDFGGRYARALEAFNAGKTHAASALLLEVVAQSPRSVPRAHHLLGRCYRAAGDLGAAARCYVGAVRAATTMDGRMIPSAAGALSDLGVALKKMGDSASATHALLHSLQLRPNHPEALATLATLHIDRADLLTHALARCLAIGRAELVEAILAALPPPLLRGGALGEEARRAARSVDLRRWPLADPALATLASFEGLLADPPRLRSSIPRLAAD